MSAPATVAVCEADLYDYDALYRVTGVAYGTPADPTALAAVAGPTVHTLPDPVAPVAGEFGAPGMGGRAAWSAEFDLLHNRMNTTEAGTGLAAPLVTEWNGNLPAGPRNFVESIGGAVFDPGADTVVLGAPLAGAAGTARGLFFHDADGNGACTQGEDLPVVCSPKRELRFSPVRMAGVPTHALPILTAEDARVCRSPSASRFLLRATGSRRCSPG